MCECRRLHVSPQLAHEVIMAEREFVPRLKPDRRRKYLELIRSGLKSSWGLCPNCDAKVRAIAFQVAPADEEAVQ